MMAVWTTVVIVACAVFLVVLERMRPYDSGQRLLRSGFLNDLLMYGIVQSYVMGVVIFAIIGFVDQHTSFERIRAIRELPLWLQLGASLVVHDFYIYWFHRWQHASPMLWRTHEAHHSTQDVDWLSGSRSHSVEILINQTVEFLPILLFASAEVAVLKGCIDAVWGMYIHANIDVRSGALQYVINGPEMHRWHHASDDAAHNKNFSTKLAIWDWLFGTAYRPANVKPSGYGIGPYPTSYIGQHLYAFRRSSSQGQES
ncbi:MAG: sterol desaturase family protein [Candidatus Kapabacteria bacterium]|nr:sterol desaturase family protein [Candidatus Kapabacteria bacterium]